MAAGAQPQQSRAKQLRESPAVAMELLRCRASLDVCCNGRGKTVLELASLFNEPADAIEELRIMAAEASTAKLPAAGPLAASSEDSDGVDAMFDKMFEDDTFAQEACVV